MQQHYQSAYKFANIQPFGTPLPPPSSNACHSINHVPRGRVFELDQFFTAQECAYYIEQAEAAGFESISQEYPPEYRNNQRYATKYIFSIYFRLLAKNEQLSQRIYNRLLEFFPQCQTQLLNVKPFGYDSHGIWIPSGIGQVVKFSKYLPGCKFLPHVVCCRCQNSDILFNL